ncbi:hypothetical protein MCOR25_001212 [Pyricularia grisea]|nr:hypothetical protein MCOR25_001212 [Pyricularia grisea]
MLWSYFPWYKAASSRRSGDDDATLGIRSTWTGSSTSKGKHSVLGVFTGQGAQWATMGMRLIESSAPARELSSRTATRATGAMMAVGTTLEELDGRLTVAACSSSSSVTLSGDLDALDRAGLKWSGP